jgi:hypothetical protein
VWSSGIPRCLMTPEGVILSVEGIRGNHHTKPHKEKQENMSLLPLHKNHLCCGNSLRYPCLPPKILSSVRCSFVQTRLLRTDRKLSPRLKTSFIVESVTSCVAGAHRHLFHHREWRFQGENPRRNVPPAAHKTHISCQNTVARRLPRHRHAE